MLAALPPPTAPIPTAPAALVATLHRTTRRIDAAIERWDKTQPPPRSVPLLALLERRTTRFVAAAARRAARVVRAAPAVRDDVAARADLYRLSARTAPP